MGSALELQPPQGILVHHLKSLMVPKHDKCQIRVVGKAAKNVSFQVSKDSDFIFPQNPLQIITFFQNAICAASRNRFVAFWNQPLHLLRIV